jgi:methylated-DNA-[protein]-cysteine S-methyltransferase
MPRRDADPPAAGFALFASPAGRCAVVWRGGALAGLLLPGADEEATRARVAAEHPGAVESAPPAFVRAALAAIRELLAGRNPDLSQIPLDMAAVPPFHRRVYEAARTLPPGSTVSYGELAARAGSPRAARAVGQALGRNPFAIVVPCHRVLAAGGDIGGFSAPGGTATKRHLLALEEASPAGGGERPGR